MKCIKPNRGLLPPWAAPQHTALLLTASRTPTPSVATGVRQLLIHAAGALSLKAPAKVMHDLLKRGAEFAIQQGGVLGFAATDASVDPGRGTLTGSMQIGDAPFMLVLNVLLGGLPEWGTLEVGARWRGGANGCDTASAGGGSARVDWGCLAPALAVLHTTFSCAQLRIHSLARAVGF